MADSTKVYQRPKISRTVPIPTDENTYNGKYRFVLDMKPGDSFVWTVAEHAKSFSGLRKVAQRSGHKVRFSSKVNKISQDGVALNYRIWRIK